MLLYVGIGQGVSVEMLLGISDAESQFDYKPLSCGIFERVYCDSV